ncbi:MAG: winged helix-turn-helix transcriptional regulator [Ruminococcaceae bacterium]|nr:winged helix-turn-helix transcriptional regulator [Oscillospiraceae bacterium]
MIDRFERFSLAISEISRAWRKLASEELAKYGLKGPHATYLTTMYRYPDGITVPKLCEVSGKDKSDASRMISILEEKGLAKKKVVDGSLYRGPWVLTDEGRNAAEQVSLRASRAVELAGKDLTDDTRTVFYEALESITANLTELCKDGIPEE